MNKANPSQVKARLDMPLAFFFTTQQHQQTAYYCATTLCKYGRTTYTYTYSRRTTYGMIRSYTLLFLWANDGSGTDNNRYNNTRPEHAKRVCVFEQRQRVGHFFNCAKAASIYYYFGSFPTPSSFLTPLLLSFHSRSVSTFFLVFSPLLLPTFIYPLKANRLLPHHP